MRQRAATTLALLLLIPTATARAQDVCPETPASSSSRRSLAKDWFSKAETAEAGSDLVVASKAYQCSLKMVPHAFTAYNLARVSEKAGDLELALETYQKYLRLAPEADDRVEVEGKIAALQARISTVATTRAPRPAAPTPPSATWPAVRPAPGRTASGPSRRDGDSRSTSSSEDDRPAFGVLGWSLAGVGAASLVGGLVLNASARAKMNDCNTLASRPMAQAAYDACDAAKPRAYGSYALFGVAAAAAVVDTILLINAYGGSADRSETNVSFAPLPGGGALFARGRF